MHRPRFASHALRQAAAFGGAVLVAVGSIAPTNAFGPVYEPTLHADGEQHLLISEVMSGGVSASDEFIELYNPGPAALPLEGLELVYVSASGATVPRRAAWDAGAPGLDPGRRLLVANEAGIFAGIADAVYTGGMAATGGSVALRIQGASSAIDAVGWGTAASTWLEGLPAPAAPVGASLERLPGGPFGSTQDSGDNIVDFVVRGVPDPQNTASPGVPDPTATPAPSASPSNSPVPTPSDTSTPTPGPSTLPIAAARSLADGANATIEGTALTGSAFTDGGGYLDDGSGAIAVLLTGGAFARGDRIRVSGEIDDRFHQRTLRADGADVVVLGRGVEPSPIALATGSVGEVHEGRLVEVVGAIVGSPSQLTTGLAFDIDDGSGSLRLVVGTATGIAADGWVRGSTVRLRGVVGQRDSTGAGTSGYRVLPRDPNDVRGVTPPASSTPGPSASVSPSPGASPGTEPLVSIAQARAAERNARLRVRGVVTLANGIIDPGSAVIQDASGAILLRLGSEAGSVRRGDHLEVVGKQSTKSGMLSLRVSSPPTRLGSAAQPQAVRVGTGAAGEAHEAQLVVVRGALVANARRASSSTVSFEIDDGSGPLRVVAGSSLSLGTETLLAGAWVEATGVLGQETTGAEPLRGYRIWLRAAADIAVLAGATDSDSDEVAGDSGDGEAGAATLDALLSGEADGSAATAATLVTGRWPELGVGGLLWDGQRLAALADDASTRRHVAKLLGELGPPVAVRVSGAVPNPEQRLGLPVLSIGPDGALERATQAPVAPLDALPASGQAWVQLVGQLAEGGGSLATSSGVVSLDVRCRRPAFEGAAGLVALAGIGGSQPPRLITVCDRFTRAPQFQAPVAGGSQGIGDGAVPTASGAGASTPAGAGRVASAALVGAAALLLGLVAGWLAWSRRTALVPPDAPAEADVDGSVDPDAAADEHPPLTLVALPRDRGSP